MDRRVAGCILACATAVFTAGCANSGPRELNSAAFATTADTSGQDAAPEQVPDLSPAEPVKAVVAPLDSPTTAPVVVLDPPTTMPTTQEVLQDGSYMTLGGIVAEVNGTPIYANTLLAQLDREFAAKAKEYNAGDFAKFARYELGNAREGAIRDEVEYAAAKRGLSGDDDKIIDGNMAQFLQQKIIEAGGSIELARRKALATGITFEQMLHQHSREITYYLYVQRHLLPRVQVSPADMLAFYNANVAKLYTQHNQARFRVIKIDPARLGGANPRAAALARINSIRDKAVRGDDFATLASTENHDDYLKARGGDPGGWIEKDSYRIDGIDKALWKIQPGQITEPVEDDGAFYIAKLEDRKIGHVQPFDDPAVQSEILNRLRTEQIKVLQDKMLRQMKDESIVRGETDDALLDPAVDIARQKYPQWIAER